jgi:hypothetical protein
MRRAEHDRIHAGEGTTRRTPRINLMDTKESGRLP